MLKARKVLDFEHFFLGESPSGLPRRTEFDARDSKSAHDAGNLGRMVIPPNSNFGGAQIFVGRAHMGLNRDFKFGKSVYIPPVTNR